MPNLRKIAKGAVKIGRGAVKKLTPNKAERAVKGLRKHLGKTAKTGSRRQTLGQEIREGTRIRNHNIAMDSRLSRLGRGISSAKMKKIIQDAMKSTGRKPRPGSSVDFSSFDRKIDLPDDIEQMLRERGARRRGLGKAMRAKQERKLDR